ncbi:hypothetical protein [Novacetimonas hansenii]|uniref:Uncharacterized protein n=1 Tax=Novacetimonas hansenii TaxID=436 RepID=A0AAW5EVN0_NOVHA|nr:hypothetical protein [Novacetimonas hansenii]MCJ8354385.1 hypothetical protein [Novacetimonas hansenii]
MRLRSLPRLVLFWLLLALPIGLTALAAGTPTTPGAPVEASRVLTARGLATRIRDTGARESVRQLERQQAWPHVIRAVSAGWGGWIALVPDLIANTDSAHVSALQAALRRGLAHNPRAVMQILDPGNGTLLGGGRICVDTGMTRRWRTGVITGLRAMHDIHLNHQVSDCLAALHAPPTEMADSGK